MVLERACALDEVPSDEALGVTIGRYDVAIARHGDEVFAVENVCSHAAVALSEGEVRGLHRRVLAARLPLRPAHRQAHRPAGHRAGRDLPRRGPRRRRRPAIYVDTSTTLNGVTPQ